MSSDYSLILAPQELSEAPLTIRSLQLGTNEQPIILRLLNFWMHNCIQPEPAQRVVHSLWVDKHDELIKGYTPVCLAREIPDFLCVGKIYMMRSVVTKRCRRYLRSCPSQVRIKLTERTDLHELPEDPDRPWFPKSAFYPTPFTALRNHLRSKTDFRDVVGRLVSVSRTETGTFGVPTIFALIEDSIGNTIMVNYRSLDHELSRASIVEAEKSGPVLLAFTSMVVVESSGYLCLLNTDATRVIHGSYEPRFRHLRDTFSHVHHPVVIGHSPTPWPVHVRYNLPAKTTLMKLGAAEKKLFPPHNSSVWCLIKIESIPTCTSHCQYPSDDTTNSPSFQLNVLCRDTSTSCMLLFNNDAAISLLQKSPAEYLGLTNTARNACLQYVIGKMFTVEIDTGEDSDIASSVFAVRTIWDPLAFSI